MGKVFGVAMLFVGTVVGAGFASGREIAEFFNGAGWLSLLFAALSALVMFAVFVLYAKCGQNLRARGLAGGGAVPGKQRHNKCDQEVFLRRATVGEPPKGVYMDVHDRGGEPNVARIRDASWSQAVPGRGGVLLEIILNVNYLIVIAAMLSGANSASGLKLPIAGAVFALLAFICVIRGIKGLVKLNAVISPILIVMIVLICVVCLLMFADGAMPTRTRGFTGAATAAVSYAAMNMLLAYGVVTEIDADYKTVVKGAALGAGILAILMGAVILSANLAGATNAAMPMLTLAEYANLSFFSRILLLTAIFTTLACAAFPLAKSVGRIVGNFKIAAAVVLAAGFALSFAGFEKIVKYFYPVTGIFGVVLICAALLHLYNTKNTARDDRVLGRISKS